ncbi:hypothetical protein CTEN210_18049 [Chaetoceros tenuissimus]|uniref:Uncharacterized protein n=1 Tax=Chaetoceros tenuissimus TaxID=426638 RepID=A0AAD3DBX8_9STRA|nr:hypothetical protein CTEN210_18049 [Chaetoceros tenuissimus]
MIQPLQQVATLVLNKRYKEEAARRKKRLSDLLDKPLHRKIVLEKEKTLAIYPKSIMVVKTQADSLHTQGLRRVKLNQIRRRRKHLQNQLSKDTASCSCSVAAGGTGSGKDDESAIFSIGSSSLSVPVVDHLPMEENSVSPQQKSAIDFSITTIREHVYIPGDNPAVMDGPPLSISWNHHSEVHLSVDEFEQAKIYNEVKTQGELKMPASRRSQILRKTGYSFTDIQKSIKNATYIRKQRYETIESLSHQRFDEAMESIGRKVNKLLRRNKKKTNKRKNNKKQAKHDDKDKTSELLDNDLLYSRGFPKSVDFVRKTSKEQKVHSSFKMKRTSKDILDFPLHRRDSTPFQDDL